MTDVTAPDYEAERKQQDRRLRDRMAAIRHKVAALSGKGGVGKSTMAANIAMALAARGLRVGLLDADVHGPSVPTVLNLRGAGVRCEGGAIEPALGPGGVRAMSIGFLLPRSDEAVIWRGPLKMALLRQLLADVNWGELDLLLLDLPPGTGDEPLSVCQLIPEADGAIVVTTPQELSLADVRRCVSFCRQLKLPVLGIVENMAGFVCPGCGLITDVFGSGGGAVLARQAGVPFLGSVPLDPRVMQASDKGEPFVLRFPGTPAACAMVHVVDTVAALAAADAMPSEETI